MDDDEQRYGTLVLEGRIDDAMMMPIEAAEMMHRFWLCLFDFWTGGLVRAAHWPAEAAAAVHELTPHVEPESRPAGS